MKNSIHMQTPSFWDELYRKEVYNYGETPNVFFKEQIDKLEKKGNLLMPGDGEGRNSTYAATKGWKVYSFDMSEVGINKGIKLANKLGLEVGKDIFFELKNLEIFLKEKPVQYDVIGLIFFHLPVELRKYFYNELPKWIAPGGLVILEGFSQNQLINNRTSGGPNKLEMLFCKKDIEEELGSNFDTILLDEVELNLEEGCGHVGKGDVLRWIGKRKNF